LLFVHTFPPPFMTENLLDCPVTTENRLLLFKTKRFF
jgi:hypothetical protein